MAAGRGTVGAGVRPRVRAERAARVAVQRGGFARDRPRRSVDARAAAVVPVAEGERHCAAEVRGACACQRDRLARGRGRIGREREGCGRRRAGTVRRVHVVRAGVVGRAAPGVVHPVRRGRDAAAARHVCDRREGDAGHARLRVVGRGGDAERPASARLVEERAAGDVLAGACRVLRQGERRATRRRAVEQDLLRADGFLVAEVVVGAELDVRRRVDVDRREVVRPVDRARVAAVRRVADPLDARAGAVVAGQRHRDRGGRVVRPAEAGRGVALDRRRRGIRVVRERHCRGGRRVSGGVRSRDGFRRRGARPGVPGEGVRLVRAAGGRRDGRRCVRPAGRRAAERGGRARGGRGFRVGDGVREREAAGRGPAVEDGVSVLDRVAGDGRERQRVRRSLAVDLDRARSAGRADVADVVRQLLAIRVAVAVGNAGVVPAGQRHVRPRAGVRAARPVRQVGDVALQLARPGGEAGAAVGAAVERHRDGQAVRIARGDAR